jgi:hypothetical protein
VRYNKAIDLLIQEKLVFCSGLVWNGNLENLAFIVDSDYDMVIIEMEHLPVPGVADFEPRESVAGGTASPPATGPYPSEYHAAAALWP